MAIGNSTAVKRGRSLRWPLATTSHSERWSTNQLIRQPDEREFVVSMDVGQVARATVSYYVPDVFIIPAAAVAAQRRRPRQLEVYRDPLPLVVEIWSPSTGSYDIDEKLPANIARGDQEIWRLHPFERTLTAWRRRPDGGYDKVAFTGGVVTLHALWVAGD